jgi:putative FmdB family regulatory protein
MPLYEFRCEACGPIDRFVAVAAVAEPQACACGAQLTRVFSTPSRRMDATRRTAGEIHERSAHAPERVSRPGHGHAHSHGSAPSRPWQLSH